MNDKQYDALIVGAGLGGLTAAASLARAGLKVGVFEQHSIPGGYATTFSRGRFEFEVAIHALSGIGSPLDRGPIFHILNDLGVAEKVDFVELTDVFRSITDDQDFTMPIGEEAVIASLCGLFPADRVGITSVMKQIMGIGAAIEHMRSEGEPGNPAEIIARFPGVGHAAGISVGRMLDARISNPRTRLAIAQLWGYFGRPPSDLSLLMFAAGMFNYIRYAPVVPKQKSQALSDAFVQVIRDKGGDVTLSCPVTRILCHGDHVTGIETAHGERFEAPIVISNIDAMTTLTRLIDRSHVPSSLTDRLSRIPPSVSSFNVYVGLNCPSTAVGITNHEVYLNRGFDLESHYRAGVTITEPESISLTAYDVLNPSVCPPGTGLVTLTLLVEGAAWEQLDPRQYPDAKNRMTQWLIRDVDARFPGFASHIETLSVATPLTNARYTGNSSGAIYGFAMTPGQSPAFRLDPKGHLKGLWYASAWTRPGGGVQAVINSGHFTAKAILKNWPKDASKQPIIARDPYTRLTIQKATVAEKTVSLGRIFKDGKRIKNAVTENKKKPVMSLPVVLSPEQTRLAVERIHASLIETRISRIIVESPDTTTLRLSPVAGSQLPAFVPGQYFTLAPASAGGNISRPYSVSSSADERGSIDFTIKKKPDGYLSGLLVDTQKEGDTVSLSGPWGNFRYTPGVDRPHLLAIAAGSGITPFISMIKTFTVSSHPEQMTLLFGSRTEDDILFKDFLAETSAQCSWLKVVHVLSKPKSTAHVNRGRLSPSVLDKYLTREDLARATCLICGPKGLFTTLSAALIERSVPKAQIRTESFGPPSPVTNISGWPEDVATQNTVQIQLSDRNLAVQAVSGETILGGLERHGAPPASRCRSNVCNSCRMELVDGKVFDAATGTVVSSHAFVRTCMCFPLTDITLR